MASLATPVRSVLVFGWFDASERELSLVERIYRRNGFQDVVVVPSPIAKLTGTRQWCNLARERARAGPSHQLSRHFDVVHCLSGGMINMYVMRAAGVRVSCSKLLLDSTPILPKPSSLSTFTRQYLFDAGYARIVRLIPKVFHEAYVRVAWFLSGIREVLRGKLGLQSPVAAVRAPRQLWLRTALKGAVTGCYERVVGDLFRTIFAVPDEVIFLYNPSDPYLDHADVAQTIAAAQGSGVRVSEVHVDYGHVRTIFTKPRLIFSRLVPSGVPAPH